MQTELPWIIDIFFTKINVKNNNIYFKQKEKRGNCYIKKIFCKYSFEMSLTSM